MDSIGIEHLRKGYETDKETVQKHYLKFKDKTQLIKIIEFVQREIITSKIFCSELKKVVIINEFATEKEFNSDCHRGSFSIELSSIKAGKKPRYLGAVLAWLWCFHPEVGKKLYSELGLAPRPYDYTNGPIPEHLKDAVNQSGVNTPSEIEPSPSPVSLNSDHTSTKNEEDALNIREFIEDGKLIANYCVKNSDYRPVKLLKKLVRQCQKQMGFSDDKLFDSLQTLSDSHGLKFAGVSQEINKGKIINEHFLPLTKHRQGSLTKISVYLVWLAENSLQLINEYYDRIKLGSAVSFSYQGYVDDPEKLFRKVVFSNRIVTFFGLALLVILTVTAGSIYFQKKPPIIPEPEVAKSTNLDALILEELVNKYPKYKNVIGTLYKKNLPHLADRSYFEKHIFLDTQIKNLIDIQNSLNICTGIKPIDDLQALAIEAIESHDLKKAQQILGKAIGLENANNIIRAELLAKQAQIIGLNLGRFEESLILLEKAIALVPGIYNEKTIKIYNILADAYLTKGELTSDFASLRKTVEIIDTIRPHIKVESQSLSYGRALISYNYARFLLAQRLDNNDLYDSIVKDLRPASFILSKEKFPDEWHRSQIVLGIILSNRANLTRKLSDADEAIEFLTHYSEKIMPNDSSLIWGSYYVNMAQALTVKGSKTSKIEVLLKAKEFAKKALSIFTREKDIFRYSVAVGNYGNTLLEIGKLEDDALSLKQALKYLNEAESLLYGRNSDRFLYIVKLNKAVIYGGLGAKGDNKELLLRAIGIWNEILKEYKVPEDHLFKLTTKMNLANDLVTAAHRGFGAEYYKRAMVILDDMLQIGLKAFDEYGFHVQLQFKRCHILRHLGSDNTNDEKTLLQAEKACNLYFLERDKTDDSDLWASAKRNLGLVLSNLGEIQNDETQFQKAEILLEEALSAYDENESNVERTGTHISLANLYLRGHASASDLKRVNLAEDHLLIALSETSQNSTPMQWANLNASLGDIGINKYEFFKRKREFSKASENGKRALEFLRNALEAPNTNFSARNLGIIHLRIGKLYHIEGVSKKNILSLYESKRMLDIAMKTFKNLKDMELIKSTGKALAAQRASLSELNTKKTNP